MIRRVLFVLLLGAWPAQAQTTIDPLAAPYNAVCNGTADDTVALQAALNVAKAISGTVEWPNQPCVVTSTLIVGGGDGPYGGTSFVNIRGRNPITSLLLWNGPSDGVALKISRNKNFRIEGLGISNQGPRGMTVGVLFGGPGPGNNGTENIAGHFDRVQVTGFHLGMTDDPQTGAFSEMTYNQVTFAGNDVGWRGVDLNTLDHVFTMLLCDHNAVCVETWAVNVTVLGGSASYSSVADFVFTSPQCVCSVRGFRSEHAERFVKHVGGASVVLDSVLVMAPAQDGIAIELGSPVQGMGPVSIRSSLIQGEVAFNAGWSSGVTITQSHIGSQPLYPVQFNGRFGGQTAVPITFTGNAPWTGQPYQDVIGAFDGFSGVVHPYLSTTTRYDGGATVFARLGHVASLAQGPAAPGRNLRIQGKFNGTKNVLVSFQRTVIASYGAAGWALQTGNINLSDVGKSWRVTHENEGERRGVILSVDVVANTFQPGYAFCGVCVGMTITIGEPEPDANYFPIHACDREESISVRNVTATGFTLRSNKATSTATCNVLILR